MAQANSAKPKMIVILGPTATGKSDLAVEIALALKRKAAVDSGCSAIGFEIISADSRQIYKGLDIGAGKISKKEMVGVPHHGLDIVSPRAKQMFTVSKFQEYAYKVADEIIARGNVPILCGGTGFYMQAVVDGIVFPDVKVNPELRKKLRAHSKERLHKMLSKLDPKRAAEINPNNVVRVIRAIEIAKSIGQTPALTRDPRFETLQIGLDTGDRTLKEKIAARVLARMKRGANMIEEAERLHDEGVSWKRMKMFGLEYGLLADLLQQKLSREQFIERLNFDIWNFVKRQRAWFRRDERITWIDPTKKRGRAKALKMAENFLDM